LYINAGQQELAFEFHKNFVLLLDEVSLRGMKIRRILNTAIIKLSFVDVHEFQESEIKRE
jgi:hypothetical protein